MGDLGRPAWVLLCEVERWPCSGWLPADFSAPAVGPSGQGAGREREQAALGGCRQAPAGLQTSIKHGARRDRGLSFTPRRVKGGFCRGAFLSALVAVEALSLLTSYQRAPRAQLRGPGEKDTA